MSAVLKQVEFDPKVKLYEFLTGLLILLVSFIGWPVVPFWVLGLGQWRSRRYYESLECALTEKTLEFRMGWLFRVEKTIPLERIQDLTLKEGPLLRAMGMCTLRVETAGQSSPQGSSEADLKGIIGPREFRTAVLAQRDRLFATRSPARSAAPEGEAATLSEVHDSLLRIEKLIEKLGESDSRV